MLGIVKEYDSASRAGIKLVGREKQETKMEEEIRTHNGRSHCWHSLDYFVMGYGTTGR